MERGRQEEPRRLSELSCYKSDSSKSSVTRKEFVEAEV